MPEILTALLLIIIAVMFVAFPAAIIFFINGAFKRAGQRSLTAERPAAPFSSPKAAGKWTVGLLGATLILAAFAVNSGVAQIELLARITNGSGITLEEVARNDSRERVVGLLQIVLFYATAVPFLVWFHRAHKNLPSLGRRKLIFSPGWAVGFFFVPVLSFFRPFQAMREIWHGSDPGRLELDVAPNGSETSDRLGTPPLVAGWWALFLISNVVSNSADSFYAWALRDQTHPGLLTPACLLKVVADLLLIPSAMVAIRLVGRLTRWQVERAESIRQRGGLPEAAPALEDQGSTYKFPHVLAGLVGLAVVAMIAFGVIGTVSPPWMDGPSASVPDRPSLGTQVPFSFSLGNSGPTARVTQRYSGSTYYEAKGEVTNASAKTFSSVMVKVEFCDRTGRVVRSLTVDACGTGLILPGEVRSFTAKGTGKLDYDSARASVVYSVEAKERPSGEDASAGFGRERRRTNVALTRLDDNM